MSENYVALSELTPYISDQNMTKIKALEISTRGLFVYVFPYFAGEKEGNISLYARGYDYHTVVTKKLREEIKALKKTYPEASFLPFADSSPFPEVMAGIKSGLGVLGKNHLLITPKYGSRVFIGVIATDLELLVPSQPISDCICCDACINACPGGALRRDGSFDINACLSHITQRKGDLSGSEKSLIKNCGTLWGCDICQNVCPMNDSALQTDIAEFREDLICSLRSDDIPETKRALQEKYPNRAFTWRGCAPLLRNALILEEDT